MNRKCDLCERSASNDFAENACCGHHRKYLHYPNPKHTHHCDRRARIEELLFKARHLSRGRHEA